MIAGIIILVVLVLCFAFAVVGQILVSLKDRHDGEV
jgi:hypothetical protein